MGAGKRGTAAGAVLALLVGAVGGALGGTLGKEPAAAVSTDQSYWVPVGSKITTIGHGYGHGHGMSQHGAQGAALAGLSYKEIADFYYPGTTWGQVSGRVRVLITADTSDDVVVSARSGLTVRDLGDRSTHLLPTLAGVSRWRIVVRDGRSVVQHFSDQWRRLREPWVSALGGQAEFFASGPMTLWTPSGPRSYRGILRSAAPRAGSTARNTVNIVSMDEYVMGVVPYEMPASWHTQAVRAQAVAARTYATWSRDQNSGRYYQICDTTSCQVYRGVSGEDPRSNAAVRDTSRQILTYAGQAAFTQFSASSGGWTSAGSMPYLPAKKDPYDGWSGNSSHTWSTTVSTSVLERRYPSLGTLRRIRVTSRDGNGDWQGRVKTLVLDGSNADVTISGDSFRWAYGLRSNWFSVEPTPIIRRWTRIGGASSRLGDVWDREYALAGGAAQRFERGRIYYHSRTGAKELYGRILRRYRLVGGPSSTLGFPRTPVRLRGSNFLARFEGGSIYHKVGTAPNVVTGAIDRAYVSQGGVWSALGWPVTSNFQVQDGERVNFEGGYIRWVRSTNTTRTVLTG